MNTIKDCFLKAQNFSREIIEILAFVCQRNSSWIIAHPEYQLNQPEIKLFTKKLKQLQTDLPLAYILGEKNFYQLSFLVNRSVLIPRPESEIIVEIIIKYCQQKNYKKQILLDLGTGSGALIISIVNYIIKNQNFFPYFSNYYFGASDISSSALKIAIINAKKQHLKNKISFRRGHLLLPWDKYLKINSNLPLLITANLPYLTPKEQAEEISIKYEPKLALIGGKDGLKLYRQLLQQIANLKLLGPLFLIMEINPQQSQTLIKEAKKYYQAQYIKKQSDLSGRTRFIIIDKP